MKDEILKMDRDQLVDFLAENWTEIVRNLPAGKAKEFFSCTKCHTVDKMRAVALSLID